MFSAKINNISQLSNSATREIKEFIVSCFPENSNLLKSVYTNSGLSKCVVVKDEKKRIIAHSSLIDRNVSYNNKNYLVAGVGNICVSSEIRKRGIGTMVMKKTNEIIKQGNYDLGMLFSHPKLHNFYTKTGWIKKKRGKVYYYKNGKKEHERTTYIYPAKISDTELYPWLHKDINIGSGTW